MKRLAACFLFLLTLLAGCSAPAEPTQTVSSSPVQLIYYTIGSVDPDLELVNDALNELLLQRYGFTVAYHKIGWNDYTDQLNGIMNTNQEFDVVFTWSDQYLTRAINGAFMDLTDYLHSQGQPLYDAVDPLFWTGVSVNNRIYGVPTNKELATPTQLLFSEELVEKYSIDVTQYRSLKSLEPLLEMVSRSEPDCIPLFLDSGRVDLIAMEGYEYLINSELPLVIRSDDSSGQILNLYETPEVRDLLRTLRRYYKSGYINADAPLRTSISRFDDEKVFCRISNGGPESSESFSIDYGYPIIAVQASEPIVTNVSTQGGIMAINSKTAHPKEAQMFLTAVNTDPDVRNLLNFGIEGTHYRLTDSDQVELISSGYRGVPYTQGNWFILKTMVGESPHKWEHYHDFNSSARSSQMLGFIPDLSNYGEICQAISRVCQKYENSLMTGAVNPEIFVPQLCKELNHVGIHQLIQILQLQVDIWLSQSKTN